MILYDQMDYHQILKTNSWQSSFNHSVRSTKDLSHKNTLLQAMRKELLMELVAKLRL